MTNTILGILNRTIGISNGNAASDEQETSGQLMPDGGSFQFGSHDIESEADLIEAFPKNFYEILHMVKAPFFVLDADGNAVLWNQGMTRLTGSTEEDARAVEDVSEAWYHDGRRSMTLADKIIETPEDTHEEYDVEKLDFVDFPLYQDSSTFTDADGETRHITFSAAPLFEDDELVGVVEMVEDRTEDVRRQQELRGIVDEVTDTMGEFEDGNLDARATVADVEHVEDEVLDVVGALNRMGDRLEAIVEDVEGQTADLRQSASDISEASSEITDVAHDQQESLEQVSSEVNQMSATIEEIASITDDVTANAEMAVDLAETGSETANEASEAMREVTSASEEVMTDVETLQERVVEIDNVVDVINDIAEQTNILALNASIEAARAGQEGEGFAVVANEVKSLAEESQTQATEIESMVAAIQDDTDETVASLEAMNDRVRQSFEDVQSTMENLDEIVDAIKETADGIEEVADATDDQATSAEEIASMVDEVVRKADQVAEQVDSIAALNEDHTEKADDIEQALTRLTEKERTH